MLSKIFFYLVISAAASRNQQGPQSTGLSEQCKKEVKSIQTKEKATAVNACEQKAGYTQKAVKQLQDGDESAARSTIEQSFQECAKFSETCAKEIAPQVVRKLQFSGAAVSDTCRQSVAKLQQDQKKMKEVAQCEEQSKVVQGVLGALNKNDLNAAVGVAKSALVQCYALSEKCANQLAPVIVNQVVMAALMEQQQQQQIPTTTVFGRVSSVVLAPQHAEKLSLVGAASDPRVHTALRQERGMSFLQKVRLPHRFVSRMILQL